MENIYFRKSLVILTIILILDKLIFRYQPIDHWIISHVFLELSNVFVLITTILLVRKWGDKTSNNETIQIDGKPSSNQDITIGQWLINYLILMIPIVGLVFLVIWANDKDNSNKSNWAKATLIWIGIAFFVSLFISFVVWKMYFDKFRDYEYNYYK
ncbi:MAG: hypothetical protein ACK566_11065 [Bacteroidota bacterium]